MMVPAEVAVGKVPVLGSGKVDFVTARAMALQGLSEQQAA